MYAFPRKPPRNDFSNTTVSNSTRPFRARPGAQTIDRVYCFSSAFRRKCFEMHAVFNRC